MILNIIKRDGREELFNKDKIFNAIMKSMHGANSVNEDVANSIASQIESMDVDCIGVEEIQDIVENELMNRGCNSTAKAYITYRNERTKAREKNAEINKKIASVLMCSDIQNQNANVDERSFGGRKFESANVLHKHIALNSFIRDEVAEAHKQNRIYIHDLSEYDIGDHNCLFVDMQKQFNDGFVTRNGDVRPAGSLATGGQQAAVIYQAQSQVQFGGVASCHLDYDLAPLVKKSFRKHYIINLLKTMSIFDNDEVIHSIFSEDMSFTDLENEDIDDIVDTLKESFPEVYGINIEDITLDNKDNLDERIYNMSYFDLMRESKQMAESLYHNLNTLESRPGSQVPFTSINFGTDTSPEGRLVTKALLNASISGIGVHHLTPIFPISIFKYKKGVNAEEGDPNYDLKKLAIKSLSKRIYPNIVNCDYSQNIEDGTPDTEMATMG